MELYVAAVFIISTMMLALWLLARRVRTWKEQILHAVSIVESNNAIAHQATRGEMLEHIASIQKNVDANIGHLRQAQDQIQQLVPQILSLRSDVAELTQQTNLRRMARTYASAARVVEDGRTPSVRFDEAIAFLRSLDVSGDNAGGERSYLEVHLRRLARTLDITPLPDRTRRALELGAYMHITPALACLLGYNEVRGGYLGPRDRPPVRKTASIAQKQIFTCDIDFFDVEKDPFPYPDTYFDVVLACEILEHLRFDPMHMLLEARRVLAPGGTLVLTTPNVASFTSLKNAMSGFNPQIWSRYPITEEEVPHVREYTPAEVHDLLADAGFVVECLFTEPIDSGNIEAWIRPLLDYLGFPTNMRGEQIYVIAGKRSEAKITRRPEFLYE